MAENNNNDNFRKILIVLMLAILAQLASVKMVHGQEAFLPDDTLVHGLTVEIRPGATVMGEEIRLRQIARWSDGDKAALDPIGELVVARFGKGMAFAAVNSADVKALLRDAGVNVATMNFAGATDCQVNRTDAQLAGSATIEQYSAAPVPTAVATIAAPAADLPVAETPRSQFHTLRQLLIDDLSQRINVPVDDLEVTFRPQDDASLRLCEPHAAFDIQPQRAAALGDVSWNINVVGPSETKRLYIRAVARAWRQQTVVSKPLASKQLITSSDVTTTRSLVAALPSDTLLGRDQVVGQMASRDMKAGIIVTARLVDPVQLVRAGQFVTISSGAGGVVVKTVAKALEPGTLGQTIQVRDEATKDHFYVTVTGNQQASLSGAEK